MGIRALIIIAIILAIVIWAPSANDEGEAGQRSIYDQRF